MQTWEQGTYSTCKGGLALKLNVVDHGYSSGMNLILGRKALLESAGAGRRKWRMDVGTGLLTTVGSSDLDRDDYPGQAGCAGGVQGVASSTQRVCELPVESKA